MLKLNVIGYFISIGYGSEYISIIVKNENEIYYEFFLCKFTNRNYHVNVYFKIITIEDDVLEYKLNKITHYMYPSGLLSISSFNDLNKDSFECEYFSYSKNGGNAFFSNGFAKVFSELFMTKEKYLLLKERMAYLCLCEGTVLVETHIRRYLFNDLIMREVCSYISS